jgi:hypothetical protein
MRDFLSELAAVAVEIWPGAAPEAISSWEKQSGQTLPDEVRSFYKKFNGARFPGGVEVLSLDSVSTQRAAPVVLGRKEGGPELLMLSKALLAERLSPLPGWVEALAQDTILFALREGSGLQPARTFEGILDRVLPARETEIFGDNTFARGMNAVQEALAALPPAPDIVDVKVVKARPATPLVKKKRGAKKAAPAKKKAAPKAVKKAKAARSPKKAAKKAQPKRAVAKVQAKAKAKPKSKAKKAPAKRAAKAKTKKSSKRR